MIISDLEISELLEANNIVTGGSYSITSAETTASPYSATGAAFGFAIGEEVYTSTKTLSMMTKGGFSSINFAFADADARAKSYGSYSLSTSTSISSNFS
ncbi:hypothetical protein [Mastigocoleus sp. MO_188.B34]|uniref:hypothetical protein n=1 Tax=Mastigocoleus sp. MO_188.B34 TaxID=3036635 RepID=UPI0026227B37|nr:hypothetical protein [Mastigocoleus sp. MO_188.B34]MDJ0696522.1 hypothetical protein [Mastigocoleus sp. MO_188.B34]